MLVLGKRQVINSDVPEKVVKRWWTEDTMRFEGGVKLMIIDVELSNLLFPRKMSLICIGKRLKQLLSIIIIDKSVLTKLADTNLRNLVLVHQ